jgi:hypothetical protein
MFYVNMHIWATCMLTQLVETSDAAGISVVHSTAGSPMYDA